MNKNLNSKLGLGTAAIGRPLYINIKQERTLDRFSKQNFIDNRIKLLNLAYDNGIRYFDTAPGYGIAEQILIDWISEKDDPTIEIATKWGYTYIANFDPIATKHEIKEHSLEKLNEQWDKSKSLMPLLTTYQIHSATLETGVLNNIPILNRLAEIKNKFGLQMGITSTGFNQSEVLKKALDVEVGGKALFDVFQVTYNIFDQSISSLTEEIVGRNKKLIIKEALANGRVFPNNKYPNYNLAYEYLNKLALKYNVGVDAIALRFCIDSIPLYKVLSGASTELHIKDNMKILDFKLEDEDIAILKKLATKPEYYWNERKQLIWN